LARATPLHDQQSAQLLRKEAAYDHGDDQSSVTPKELSWPSLVSALSEEEGTGEGVEKYLVQFWPANNQAPHPQ
jgi:hypothetical protein